jgi:hypothetical protein
MKSIHDCVGRQLDWIQPRMLKQEYELRDGDELVSTLRFRSALGTFAIAEAAEGSWSFKRVGFWRTKVTIRVAGSDREIAVFRNNTWSGGGTLDLSDGREFPADTNFWRSSYQFKDGGGEPLVRYRKIGGLLHSSCKVELAPAAVRLPELPWLAPLGWYLAVMMQHDAGGAAAAAAAG